MPKKDVKSLDAYKLPKNRERWLEAFIENASSRSLSAAPWDVNWNLIHGEGRATTSRTAKITFHIGIRKISAGNYESAVMVHLKEGNRRLPIVGTQHDWGVNTEPTLLAILNHYKVKYGKPVVEDPAQNGQGDPGEGPADGPAQADGAQDWVKDVQPNRFGGYYYFDQEYNNITCDEQGNPLPVEDKNEDEDKDKDKSKDEDEDEGAAPRDEIQGRT